MVNWKKKADRCSKKDKSKETHAVIGGGGYAGFLLGKALSEKGHNVVLFDVQHPIDTIPEGCKFLKGDIGNVNDLEASLVDVDCVYHLASYGMSGREQLNKKLIEAVNVDGTRNVIEVCCKLGIDRLVYTSTYNVIFGGQVIENGDESMPYLPLDKHPDWYSRTKSIAEQIVLKSNQKEVQGGTKMKTCALRLAGIYGPGEQRHMPRIVRMVEQGWFKFTYGSKHSLVEFLHIDNFVLAHVLAGEALKPTDTVAAGQPYFISDCKPVNNFEFFRPLVEGLGQKYPKIRLPLIIVYFMAFLTEICHVLVSSFYNFQPFLTRTEVYKTGVTHYFNNGKAKEELGYNPIVQNDIQCVVRWFLQRGHGKKKPDPRKQFLLDLCIGLLFAMLIMSLLPFVS